MSEARLAAWRDRRRDLLTFRLHLTDPDTGRTSSREYMVPDRPAGVWALAYLSDDPADLLLDVLEEEDGDELWDEACDPDSDLTVTLLHNMGRSLLGRAAGRPWWQAGALLVTLAADWPTFDAIAADRNLGDPLAWPLERLCNWVYLKMTQNKEADEVARIDAMLATPPEGLDPDDLADEAGDEGADWFAAMASMTGGVADENGVARG